MKRLLAFALLVPLVANAGTLLRGTCAFTAPTTAVTVNCSDPDFGGQPPIAGIFMANAATADDTITTDPRPMIGMFATTGGITQAVISGYLDDARALGVTIARTFGKTGAVAGFTTANNSFNGGEATVSAVSANTATLSFSAGAAGAYKMKGLLLGEANNNMQANVVKCAFAAGTTCSVADGITGTPDILVFMGNGKADGGSGGTFVSAFGYYDVATTSYASGYHGSGDGASITSDTSANSITEFVVGSGGSAHRITVTTLDGTNIGLTSDTSGTQAVYILVLKGTDGALVGKAGAIATPASTGIDSGGAVTGMSVAPKALLMWGSKIGGSEGTSTIDLGATWSLGMAVSNAGGTGQHTMSYSDDDNVTTTVDKGQVSNAKIINLQLVTSGASDVEATKSSWDSGGFTLNYSNVFGATGYLHYLAIGMAGDTTAPTVSGAIAQSAISETSVGATMTCTDASGAYTAYFGTYADGSAPTAANVKAGAGAGFVASTAASDAKATAVQASYTSGSHLTGGTAYDVKAICEDADGNQTTVQNLNITTSAPAANDAVLPVMVNDTFTAANNTTLAARTPSPVNTPGNNWSKVKFYTPATLGTVDIQTNKASAGAESGAVVDVEVTDMDITADIADFTVDHVIATRQTDSDNYNRCRFRTNRTVELTTVVGGAYVNLATTASAVPVAPYVGEMFAVGTQLGCLVDGVLVNTAVSSSNANATKAGFGANASTATFDNVYIKRAYPCLNSSINRVNDDPDGLFSNEQLASGCLFWSKTQPVNYNTWSLYEGGRVVEDFNDADDIGTETWTWSRWNPVTGLVESADFTIVAQDTGATAPVWIVAAQTRSLPIGEAYSENLCNTSLTVQGVPQATITTVDADLPAGLGMADGCTLAGTPSTGYAAARTVTFTATNASGAPTKNIVFTITGDDVPVPFLDESQLNVPVNAPITTVTSWCIQGINIPAVISIAGDGSPEYSIDAGAFTSLAGTITENQCITQHQTSSAVNDTPQQSTVDVGGVQWNLNTLTEPAAPPIVDSIPNALPFGSVSGVAINSTVSFTAVQLGVDEGVTVNYTAVNGECSETGVAADFGATCGPFANGATVYARHTSSGSLGTAVDTTLTGNGVQSTARSVTMQGAQPVCLDVQPRRAFVGDTETITLTCANATTFIGDPTVIGGCSALTGGTFTCTYTTPTRGTQSVQFQTCNSFGCSLMRQGFIVAPVGGCAALSSDPYCRPPPRLRFRDEG